MGARSGLSSQASIARWSANSVYNRLASWMVNREIPDLTSGFRCVHRLKFLDFLPLAQRLQLSDHLHHGFFPGRLLGGVCADHGVARLGSSHINIVRDGVRFLLIIFKIGTLYSPLKVYFPVAALISGLGMVNYLYSSLASGSLRHQYVHPDDIVGCYRVPHGPAFGTAHQPAVQGNRRRPRLSGPPQPGYFSLACLRLACSTGSV